MGERAVQCPAGGVFLATFLPCFLPSWLFLAHDIISIERCLILFSFHEQLLCFSDQSDLLFDQFILAPTG